MANGIPTVMTKITAITSVQNRTRDRPKHTPTTRELRLGPVDTDTGYGLAS
jgi:hypothetical protein